MSRASLSLSGSGASATSLKISTLTPPSPTISSGPKVASRFTPRITSRPSDAIGCTSTPSTRAFGAARNALASTRWYAAEPHRPIEIEGDGAGFRLVRDVGRLHFQRHRAADLLRAAAAAASALSASSPAFLDPMP